MTQGEFENYLTYAIYICIGIAVVALFRFKRRGVSALHLTASILSLAGVLYALKQDLGQVYVIALGVLVGVFAFLDAATRPRKDFKP